METGCQEGVVLITEVQGSQRPGGDPSGSSVSALQARVRQAERARLDPESLALWDEIDARRP
jgi:hypothetical protein